MKVEREEKQIAVSKIAEVEVNEQEVVTEEVGHRVRDDGRLNPGLVEQERKEEINCSVETLNMFEFVSWVEAATNAVNSPTTTKWVDRVEKDDEGHEFVRCRPVVHPSLLTQGRLPQPVERGASSLFHVWRA